MNVQVNALFKKYYSIKLVVLKQHNFQCFCKAKGQDLTDKFAPFHTIPLDLRTCSLHCLLAACICRSFGEV